MLTNSNFLPMETGKKEKKLFFCSSNQTCVFAWACVCVCTSSNEPYSHRDTTIALIRTFLAYSSGWAWSSDWETILSPETLSFNYLACVTFDFNGKNISAGTRLVYWFASSVAYPITLPTAIWLSDFFTIHRFLRNNTDLWHRQFAKSKCPFLVFRIWTFPLLRFFFSLSICILNYLLLFNI